MLVILMGLLAACTPGGASNGETESDGGDVTAITLVTPDTGDSYPSAGEGAYPVSPVEAFLPTGYPELTVVAPSGEVDPTDLTPVAPDMTPQAMPAPGRPGNTTNAQQTRFLEALTRELSEQTDVPVDEIQLISADEVLWSNTSLGCPAEGVAYAEVIVEGMLITLEAAGQTFEYHTDGAQQYVLCRDGEPVSTGTILP